MGHTGISTSTVWRVWRGLETGVSPTRSVSAACVVWERSLTLPRSRNSHGTSPQFSAWKGREIRALFTHLTAEQYTRKQKQSGTPAGENTGPGFWHSMFFCPHSSILIKRFITGSKRRAVPTEVRSLSAIQDPKNIKNPWKGNSHCQLWFPEDNFTPMVYPQQTLQLQSMTRQISINEVFHLTAIGNLWITNNCLCIYCNTHPALSWSRMYLPVSPVTVSPT